MMITDYEKIKKNIANVRGQVNLLSRRQRDVAEDMIDELERLINNNAPENDIQEMINKFNKITEWCEDAVLWNAF